MIKGCQKRMIHVKNTNSPYFEEAYFILKNDVDPEPSENDMLTEAQRIAEESLGCEKTGRIKMSPKKITIALLSLSAVSFILSAVILIACIFA